MSYFIIDIIRSRTMSFVTNIVNDAAREKIYDKQSMAMCDICKQKMPFITTINK